MKRRVVITGLGSINPLGTNIDSSWEALINSHHAIVPIKPPLSKHLKIKVYAPIKQFNTDNILDPKTVKRLDQFTALACVSAKQALIDAGIKDLPEQQRLRFGVSIGVGMGGVEKMRSASVLADQQGLKKVSPFLIPQIIPNIASGMVAIDNHLFGPNLCSATACASGSHGIIDGYFAILNHQCDRMIAGGSESAMSSIALASFSNMKALSTSSDPNQASIPFDLNRNGFVMGEGCGVCVLEELSIAKKRGAKIYAELLGVGLSCDAYHMTAPYPDGQGYQRAMNLALHNAQLDVKDIDYINAHGTSTLFNDLYETIAIKKLFKDHAYKLGVSSTKGATGHLLGGAGGVEACFSVLSIYHQIAPPTLGLQNPDPQCDLDYISQGGVRNKNIKYMLSNSFGFGGTNATLVFGKFIH